MIGLSLPKIFRSLGPGLLYAGAAVGVSHLVQSTRAGADFGFTLVWVVLLAHLLKYPFFEFGPRYAAATGNSLLHGYRKLGRWAVLVFFVMTFLTMFIIQAAITIVTVGLAEQITGAGLSDGTWAVLLLGTCMLVLGLGRFSILDKLMKGIILILSLTTVIALVAAFSTPIEKTEALKVGLDLSQSSHILFLVALFGWMPAPIDISVWHSVWAVAKNKENGRKSSMKEALLDFKIGFWGTAILALCFLSLGALTLYGTGQELASSGKVFAGQVISLYTTSIGEWAYLVIALAAFTTMFSTTLTCLDAFPRVLRTSTQLLIGPVQNSYAENKTADGKSRLQYWIYILITAGGALLIIGFFLKSMKWMVDLATTVSFVTAPILAILNHMVMFGKDVAPEHLPGKGLKALSWIGIIFLMGFSLFFLYYQFGRVLI